MSEYPFKEKKKKTRMNELVLTRNLFNEPSNYFHRKLHNTHRHIRKSSKTYATRAQTTQHSPVIQLISRRKKNNQHTRIYRGHLTMTTKSIKTMITTITIILDSLPTSM